jgi:Arc/MetJ family transcription regulator
MVKRTTIEIDRDLLERARRALGKATARATIEEALRRATSMEEAQRQAKASRQRAYLEGLASRTDLDVLRSEEMWR